MIEREPGDLLDKGDMLQLFGDVVLTGTHCDGIAKLRVRFPPSPPSMLRKDLDPASLWAKIAAPNNGRSVSTWLLLHVINPTHCWALDDIT